MKFNIYYTNTVGYRGKISDLDIDSVLRNVNACLVLGDEITSIINVEDDQ